MNKQLSKKLSLNVLHFTSSFPYNGNPVYGVFVYDLVRSIDSKINQVVLSPKFTGTTSYEEEKGYKIYRWHQCCPTHLKIAGQPGGILPALKRNPILIFFLPFFILSEFICLRNVVKKEAIHIIHAHWLIPQGLLAAVYKRFFDKNVKLIITCHGSDVNKVNSGLLRRLKIFTLKNADKIITVSDDLASKILALYPNAPCITQPMGVDTDLFTHEAAENPIDICKKYNLKSNPVLFVGSLIELKGVKDLIQAWKKVLECHPDAELLIIGRGELQAELQEMCNQLKISERVHFAGMVKHDDLPVYFSQSSIFVLPSFSEGFSLVVSEALSCCTPVIISAISIFETLYKDKTFVSFCKPGDSLSIADAIITQLSCNSHKNTAGREWVKQNISQKIVAERHYAIYTEIMDPNNNIEKLQKINEN